MRVSVGKVPKVKGSIAEGSGLNGYQVDRRCSGESGRGRSESTGGVSM